MKSVVVGYWQAARSVNHGLVHGRWSERIVNPDLDSHRLSGWPVDCFASTATSCRFAPAPATPLVVHDPYFSIWSNTDRLTDGPTRHWTGAPQPLNGLIRVDTKNYRYLGNANLAVPAMLQTGREVTPTRTIVTLQTPEIELRLTFLTPALPNDLRVMSRPITYLTWDAKSRDGGTHDVSIYLDADGSLATDSRDEPVTWSRAEIAGLHLLRTGTSRQAVLERYGDNLRIDWGYFYIAVPSAGGAADLAAGNQSYRDAFLATGHIPAEDDLEQPRVPESRYPSASALNVVMPLGAVGATSVSRHVLLGYDDVYSVEYMRQKLLPYGAPSFPPLAPYSRRRSGIIHLWRNGRRRSTPIGS